MSAVKWVLAWLTRFSATELKVIGACLVALVGYAVYRAGSRSLRRLVASGQLRVAMAGRLRVLLRLALLVLTLFAAVAQAGLFQHAWAVVSALATTVAIGFFAVWSVLSNMVCALLILVFRPFRVGDWIELLEGTKPPPAGLVVDMNLLFVTLADTEDEGLEMRIPNSLIFQKVLRRRAPPSSPRRPSFFA